MEVALATPTGFLAFGLGSGLSPIAPGTAGTLAALPFAVLIAQLPLWAGLIVVGSSLFAGVYLCRETTRRLGVRDHGGIVWDEFCGTWLVLVLLPFAWTWWLAGVALFRAFDILKPWPIRILERKVGGGAGILLDDLLAAFYALAVLYGGAWIFVM